MSTRRLRDVLAGVLGVAGIKPKALSTEQRARNLIVAIDAGGVPLNPMIVNDIARQLGLVVDVNARIADTIAEIRRALVEGREKGG